MDTLRRMRESALYGAELLAAAGPTSITYEATARQLHIGGGG